MAALRKSSTVLVTGASGFIGSAVVAEALNAGLKVRATARTDAKAQQLKAGFATSPHSANLDVVVVPDMGAPGAFTEAVKGVQGIAHVASPVTYSPKWEDLVTPCIVSHQALLEAAASDAAITRVVITSSGVAIAPPSADEQASPSSLQDSWNDAAVQLAKTAPNPMAVYTASKVLPEQLAWEFMRSKKPHFGLTAVLPTVTVGCAHPGASSTSTHAMFKGLVNGNPAAMGPMGAPRLSNVTDIARLHVAALMRRDVKNERILGYMAVTNWAGILASARKADPARAAALAHLDTTAPEFNRQDPAAAAMDSSRMREILGHDHVADIDVTVRELLGVGPVHSGSYLP